MFFLLRAAFWLFVVFMLLPAGTVGRPSALLAGLAHASSATAGPSPTLTVTAENVGARAGAACLAHAAACQAGLAAASRVGTGVANGLSLLGRGPASHLAH